MQKRANNAYADLVSPITDLGTTITISALNADRFPVADTGADPVNTDGKDWFKATLENTAGDTEIVYIRTRTLGSGVLADVIRGQEDTTAIAFTAGSIIEIRDTAQDFEDALSGNFPTATIAGKITQDGVDGRVIPVGGIVMYSGAIVDIPTGWQLCDGTNGTPNLRDKFVVGAGTTYPVAASGGSKDAVVVAHDHDATFTGEALSNHDHSITDAGHQHSFTGQMQLYGNIGGGSNVLVQISSSATNSATTGIDIDAASAGTPAGNIDVADEGVSGTDKNLPPYYALAFIQCMGF